MRAVVQRVNYCRVYIDGELSGSISDGLCVLLAVGEDDSNEDADYLLDKIINLRIFADEDGKMNLSARDLNKELMVISQFTLYGDCRQGRRPGYGDAAQPDRAEKLYDYFIEKLGKTDLEYDCGEFKEYMEVELSNDGPVTLMLDSKKNF